MSKGHRGLPQPKGPAVFNLSRPLRFLAWAVIALNFGHVAVTGIHTWWAVAGLGLNVALTVALVLGREVPARHRRR